MAWIHPTNALKVIANKFANSMVHINYWEPKPMYLFSCLFLYFRYRHMFSLKSRDTTIFTPFSLSSWTRLSIPKLNLCFYNSLRYFGNTDRVHLACKQGPMGCRCAHVSVKREQVQLASMRSSGPWIDAHSSILLCHIIEGDNDI